jgi:hypothetical protein
LLVDLGLVEPALLLIQKNTSTPKTRNPPTTPPAIPPIAPDESPDDEPVGVDVGNAVVLDEAGEVIVVDDAVVGLF